MNPNQILNDIRDIIDSIDQHGLVDDPEELIADFTDLYKSVKALDNYLTSKKKGGKGGYLPDDWDQ